MKRVVISDTPHLRNKISTRGIMLDVLIALLPATVVGCVYFGWRAVVTLVLSVAGAVLTEFVWLLCKRVNIKAIIKQFDLTSVVTGLLLGLTMPAFEYSSWYVPLICSVFAIAVVKNLHNLLKKATFVALIMIEKFFDVCQLLLGLDIAVLFCRHF